MKVLLTGASGLIGRQLSFQLMKNGHSVVALARNPDSLPEIPHNQIFKWSDTAEAPSKAFEGCDAVIHLAGEGIADKLWTSERKKRLRESRVLGTRNLVKAIASLSPDHRPKIFIGGSAIGIYQQTFEAQNEESSFGNDFLSQLCIDWESESIEAQKLGLRTVLLRTGLVLSRYGGLLSKSAPVVLGSGKQWMSWIHINDVVKFIVFALENSKVSGPYNLTSPNPATNQKFTDLYAKAKGIPATIKAPELLLKLVTGEMSQAILANQKVLPKRALEHGFQFEHTDLETALQSLLSQGGITDNFFSTKQFVPLEKPEVFSFFSKAENLETLTPPWLNFHIVDKSTPEIQKNTLINYKLKIRGVPVRWRTLIKEWNPDDSFVDFQLKGPYQKWHHLHTFHKVPGGTLISDDVNFIIPGWIFGKLLTPLIRRDVQQIFNYRQKVIKQLCEQGNLK